MAVDVKEYAAFTGVTEGYAAGILKNDEHAKWHMPSGAAKLEKAAELVVDMGGGNITIQSNIKLNSPFMITEDTGINLNGYTIESTQDVFDVSAKLTIEGEGKVIAATDNTCSWSAVFAHDNADVTINGGEYSVGAPDGDYNDLIYAKDNAKITINDGIYHSSGSVRKDGTAFVLNLKDNSNASIVVNGGTFDGFNPAKANTEPGGDYNFVADGYEAIEDPTSVWNVSKVEVVVDENKDDLNASTEGVVETDPDGGSVEGEE